MAHPWPASLPQHFEANAQFSYQKKSNLIVSQPEVGPSRSRRRATTVGWTLSGTLRLDSTQRATLQGFFDVTLFGGTQPFAWVDPIDRNAATFKFLAEPAYGVLNQGTWTAALQLEQLP